MSCWNGYVLKGDKPVMKTALRGNVIEEQILASHTITETSVYYLLYPAHFLFCFCRCNFTQSMLHFLFLIKCVAAQKSPLKLCIAYSSVWVFLSLRTILCSLSPSSSCLFLHSGWETQAGYLYVRSAVPSALGMFIYQGHAKSEACAVLIPQFSDKDGPRYYACWSCGDEYL